jgi:DNA-binding NarL/FixJ family response regulator
MFMSKLSDELMLEALSAGADGCCFKEVSQEQLIKVVNNAIDGGVWLDPVVSRKMIQCMELTAQETALLTLQAEGLDNREIAERMNISRSEVVAMIKGVVEKLN